MDTLTHLYSHAATILLEGGALLLIGALTSGLLDAFLSPADVAGRLPRRALPAALVGSLLGLVFPAGGLGSILIARRLLWQGAAPAFSFAYLAASPAITLVALAALAAVLGHDHAAVVPVVTLAALALALLTGLLFALIPAAEIGALLRQQGSPARPDRLPLGLGLRHALTVARHEGAEIAPWLVLGALLSACASAILAPDALDRAASGPAQAVWAGLALGISQGTDPIASALTMPDLIARFGAGAATAALIAGGPANLTRLVALLAVFRWRAAGALGLLSGLIALLVGVWMALNTTL